MPGLSLGSEQILFLSILALALGPLMHALARRAKVTLAALDGFVLIAVGGLVFLDILPEAYELAGWPVLVAAAVGYLIPTVAEGRFGLTASHRAAIWIALAGLALHAVADGLGIATARTDDTHVHSLEFAIVLHRVPVGIGVWWLLGRVHRGGAFAALGLIAVATVFGFMLGEASADALRGPWLGVVTAVVAGLLLHVVNHTSDSVPRADISAGLGGLLGLAVLTAMLAENAIASAHSGALAGVVEAFLELVYASAPALLLAYGLAGLLSVLLGEASARWLARGNAFGRALRGVGFGLPLPLCSCGVVPVYRGLVRTGVPASAAVAFLVATPELGLDAVLLSLPLLGPSMTILRVGAAFVVALIIGWLVGGWIDRLSPARPVIAQQIVPNDSLRSRVVAGLRTGYGELVDVTGPWVLLGLVIAAAMHPWLDPELLAGIPDVLEVAVSAMVGMPLYVCAAGATPLVAVLIAKGLSPGAALAFLLTGPATNATTYGVLRQLHGRKMATGFALSIVVAAVFLGYATNAVWPEGFEVPVSLARHVEDPGNVALGSAIGLGVIFVLSFVRQGPRRFLGRLWEGRSHAHDHDHDCD